MNHFYRIGDALRYIDDNLSEELTLEFLADQYHFSPYYFHRLFSAIVGKPLSTYIRDRRILFACKLLCNSKQKMIDIALDCGFHSAQSFSRTFKEVQGSSPSSYRKLGHDPEIISADELVRKFTNRLKGGVYVNPNIIKKETMLIAGLCGDGDQTAKIWEQFENLVKEKPLKHAVSNSGYEIRFYDGDKSTVHVGYLVEDRYVDEAYTIFELPASRYASFDVYVANGYMSENDAMFEWLGTNEEGYSERLLKPTTHYCVEYYDERFNGEEKDSIVEIWLPIEKHEN